MSVTPGSSKLEALSKMLEKQPNDAFLLYGLAMEHKKLGDPKLALDFLARTIAVDPSYCYAYFQQGQVNEQTGDENAARQAYRNGIEAAIRANDAHAKSELEGALEMMG